MREGGGGHVGKRSNNAPLYATETVIHISCGNDVLSGFFTHVTDIIPSLFLGSGKTYTMMGSQNQTGLIPRLCNELFDRISSVS